MAGGRPTDYQEKYSEQVYKLCRIFNFNEPQIAYFFGVTEESLQNWVLKVPEFSEAISRGRKKYPETILNRQMVKDRRNARRRKSVSDNPSLRIRNNISAQLSYHLKNKNGRHVFDLLGYSCSDLMAHLEKQFKQEMTWDNYGKYWHVDHKTPASWFKYEDVNCEEFKECWALSNLQPLEASLNIKKNNCYASA